MNFFDMMRFGYPMVRSSQENIKAHLGAAKSTEQGGYPKEARFNLEPENPNLLFQFPRVEILNNPKVVQNPVGAKVADQW